MMAKSALVPGLHLVVSIVVSIVTAEGGVDPEGLIQDSVRRLLGVSPETVPGRNASLPPQFVMDLYERYRSGRSPMQGNTVRSILPLRDIMGEGDVFIYNLSRIHPAEQILQGKLFILKRQKPKSGKKRDHSFRIKIGNLPNLTSHRYVNVSLSHGEKKSQWQWYDITDSIVQCRQGKGDHILGATLEIKRAKGSYRLVLFKRLLKHNSQPFILIYSDLNNNQTRSALKPKPQNALQGLLRTKVDRDSFSAEDYLNDQDYSSEDYSLRDRRKRSVASALYAYHAITRVERQKSESELEYVLPFLNFESVPNISDFKELHSIVDVLKMANSNVSEAKVTRDVLVQILNSTSMNRLKDLLTTIDNFKDLAPEIFSNVHNRSELIVETSKNLDFEKLLKVLLNKVLPQKEPKSVAERANSLTQLTLESQRVKRSISPASNSKEFKVLQDTGNTFQTVSDKPGLSSSKASLADKPGLSSGKTIGDELSSNKTVGEKTVHKGSSSNKMARRRNRQKGRTSRRHKHKRRRHKKLPFWWTRHARKFHSSERKNLCQRKSLVVDFTKLGWGEWVMSPKSFNAYYCSGSCDFPLTKDTHPSNHAAIQSLVHALGRTPSVPASCCVPSQTSSLTMLYFDENGSLVLKSYSDMIVDKCACR